MGMGMGINVERFDVFLVSLEPAQGSELRKTRPCLIISPDEINAYIRTVIVAPMTTVVHNYPTRVTILFQGRTGQVALDQIRVIEKTRLIKRLGKIKESVAQRVLQVLQKMFA